MTMTLEYGDIVLEVDGYIDDGAYDTWPDNCYPADACMEVVTCNVDDPWEHLSRGAVEDDFFHKLRREKRHNDYDTC